VRGAPHSPPLALLLAAGDAARAGDPPGAATAILHFLDYQTQHSRSASLLTADWALGLLELAAGGALTALGAVQPVVAPSAWLSAYARLAGSSASAAGSAAPLPPPRGPAAAPPPPSARAADAVAALTRATRLLLALKSDAPSRRGRGALLPLCILLTAAQPEAPAGARLAPLEQLAWRHLATLHKEAVSASSGALWAGAAGPALALLSAPAPRRNAPKNFKMVVVGCYIVGCW
jgi:hypothetical protein